MMSFIYVGQPKLIKRRGLLISPYISARNLAVGSVIFGCASPP